ncbi:MAG: hypothetical protein NTZ53_00010 [Cyanobacteria bacterium]|nr:hypothetical protein [Cyanobacteriota bacterium]
MTLQTNLSFNGSITDSLGGSEVITTFGANEPSLTPENSSSAYGSDQNGDYWSWTSGQQPGGGFRIDTDLQTGNTYTIALRFSFQQVSGYRKIIDFSNLASDTGFYVLSGEINFYPLGTAPQGAPQGTTARTFSAGDVIDLIATRDSGGYFTVYVNDGQGGYVQQIRVLDTNAESVPALVNGKYRLGFFYDDIATSSEYSSGGKVWNVRIWEDALDPSQISQALSSSPPVSSTRNHRRCRYGAQDW